MNTKRGNKTLVFKWGQTKQVFWFGGDNILHVELESPFGDEHHETFLPNHVREINDFLSANIQSTD
jgi:hypothetical protein